MTAPDPDPEVERIAELAWQAYHRLDAGGWWPRYASQPDAFRAVARAVIADRAAQEPTATIDATNAAWAEACAERDVLQREIDALRVTCSIERDWRKAGAAKLATVNARLYEAEARIAGDKEHLATVLSRNDELEHDCDALQSRLGALRREPTAREALNLFYMSRDWKADQGDTERIWAFVRDALLTAQEPAAVSVAETAGDSSTPVPAPASTCFHDEACSGTGPDCAPSLAPASCCKHGSYTYDPQCLRCVSYESGRAAERAAVVAWLRSSYAYRSLDAFCIERGEHVAKGEEKP